MPVIQVEDLAKTFTSLKKDSGLRGTIRSLYTRQTVSVQAVTSSSTRPDARRVSLGVLIHSYDAKGKTDATTEDDGLHAKSAGDDGRPDGHDARG